MTTLEHVRIASSIYDDLLAKVEKLKDLGRIGFSDIPIIYQTIVETVILVEKYAKEVSELSGSEKKEVAVIVINRLVNIPVIPEPVEAKLISVVIDLAVMAINRSIGKIWIGKLI